MIKKVKRRFIALSMVIVGVILALFYITICALLFVQITDSVQNSLEKYAADAFYDEKYDIGTRDADNTLFDVIDDGKVCVVSVSDTGVIKQLESGHAYMARDILDEAIGVALDSDYPFGHIPEHMLFYGKAELVSGVRIAFADSSGYYEYLSLMMKAGAILCVAAMLLLFVISNIMASIFIRPLQKNWDQQKDFIADASHELKTPLTVVLANCRILEDHPDLTVGEQIKWIKSTDEEASHMKELVNKMLFLAKNDIVKTDKVKIPVNISDMVTSLALQFEPVAYEAGVSLISNVEKGVTISSDPTSVNQIVHILIDNAVKYAGIGGEVTVSLRKKNKNVFLSTKNTGEPMSAEELEHIFERFYRSDKARTSGSGYGLGLPICRSLVNGIGANITVSSDKATGTVFTVKFKIK